MSIVVRELPDLPTDFGNDRCQRLCVLLLFGFVRVAEHDGAGLEDPAGAHQGERALFHIRQRRVHLVESGSVRCPGRVGRQCFDLVDRGFELWLDPAIAVLPLRIPRSDRQAHGSAQHLVVMGEVRHEMRDSGGLVSGEVLIALQIDDEPSGPRDGDDRQRTGERDKPDRTPGHVEGVGLIVSQGAPLSSAHPAGRVPWRRERRWCRAWRGSRCPDRMCRSKRCCRSCIPT